MQAIGRFMHAGLGQRRDRVPAPHIERIRDGLVVALHYTLKLDNGNVVESFCGSPPFLYLHGAGNIVHGLERELTHCKVGDRLAVTVPPELGYGHLNPDFVQRIPRSEFPPHIEIRPGMRFLSAVGDANLLPAHITDVDQHSATVSFNHPLAGQTLHFAVAVIDVRHASTEEVLHGHPHGPGGVQH